MVKLDVLPQGGVRMNHDAEAMVVEAQTGTRLELWRQDRVVEEEDHRLYEAGAASAAANVQLVAEPL